MYAVLNKFLTLFHHLTLPGIGNLRVEQKPAQIDIANRSVYKPAPKIIFSNEELPADRQFFHFLSQELHIDEVQAIRRFTDFATQLQADIKANGVINLKGLGTLKKQNGNTLAFEQSMIPEYFPVLTAERIVRKNATHTVMVGETEKTSDEMHAVLEEEAVVNEDRWWIPAIILAVIGIAALIYYYNVLHGHF